MAYVGASSSGLRSAGPATEAHVVIIMHLQAAPVDCLHIGGIIRNNCILQRCHVLAAVTQELASSTRAGIYHRRAAPASKPCSPSPLTLGAPSGCAAPLGALGDGPPRLPPAATTSAPSTSSPPCCADPP